MARKAPDAFRTISEVAELLDTPAHVLRFWESKFRQIKPVKRAGGRRYYRPQDIDLISGIKRLLHDQGMTIKGAQKILSDKGVKHVAGLAPVSSNSLEAGPVLEMEPPSVAPEQIAAASLEPAKELPSENAEAEVDLDLPDVDPIVVKLGPGPLDVRAGMRTGRLQATPSTLAPFIAKLGALQSRMAGR